MYIGAHPASAGPVSPIRPQPEAPARSASGWLRHHDEGAGRGEAMTPSNAAFARYIAEALRQPFAGWDFSYLRRRMVEDHPTWAYSERVRRHFAGVDAMLDMGTGGGEVL